MRILVYSAASNSSQKSSGSLIGFLFVFQLFDGRITQGDLTMRANRMTDAVDLFSYAMTPKQYRYINGQKCES